MRWNHHVHENMFLQRISVPEYWNLFLTAPIWFVKWTEQVIVVYKKYYIIFILLFSPPPPSNEMWSDFFPIFSKNIHMYLNIRYSLLVPYRQQLQETRVPKCQLTSLITSIFLPLIHRCPPLDECFNPLAVPKLCEEKEKKTQLNFYHFGR